MRSNILNEYLKTLAKYTFALIIAMLFKILVIDLVPANTKEDTTSYREEKSTKLEYKIEPEEDEKSSLTRPIFEDDYLNTYIDNYIENGTCSNLEYDIFELGKGRVNIFLNCGNPQNIVYDYVRKKELSNDDLIAARDQFIETSKRLLNLKYPTFVTDDIIWNETVYDIKSNEIVAYYETNEFGKATYKINNNEIKDLMTYEMQYDDAYENEVYVLDSNKKSIAFTFDDGPSTYDLYIIDALVASHSKATFYMVGNRMKNFPSSIEKMVATGMEMGNHTYDHASLTSLGDAQVKEQITKTNAIFNEMTGRNLTSLRPSYGNVDKRIRLQVGLPVVLWSIDTLDWKSRNADKVYEAIISEAKDGDIVLMHSLYPSTLEAVRKVLPELYKMGFQVVSVEQLAKLKGYNLTPGTTIWNIK